MSDEERNPNLSDADSRMISARSRARRAASLDVSGLQNAIMGVAGFAGQYLGWKTNEDITKAINSSPLWVTEFERKMLEGGENGTPMTPLQAEAEFAEFWDQKSSEMMDSMTSQNARDWWETQSETFKQSQLLAFARQNRVNEVNRQVAIVEGSVAQHVRDNDYDSAVFQLDMAVRAGIIPPEVRTREAEIAGHKIAMSNLLTDIRNTTRENGPEAARELIENVLEDNSEYSWELDGETRTLAFEDIANAWQVANEQDQFAQAMKDRRQREAQSLAYNELETHYLSNDWTRMSDPLEDLRIRVESYDPENENYGVQSLYHMYGQLMRSGLSARDADVDLTPEFVVNFLGENFTKRRPTGAIIEDLGRMIESWQQTPAYMNLDYRDKADVMNAISASLRSFNSRPDSLQGSDVENINRFLDEYKNSEGYDEALHATFYRMFMNAQPGDIPALLPRFREIQNQKILEDPAILNPRGGIFGWAFGNRPFAGNMRDRSVSPLETFLDQYGTDKSLMGISPDNAKFINGVAQFVQTGVPVPGGAYIPANIDLSKPEEAFNAARLSVYQASGHPNATSLPTMTPVEARDLSIATNVALTAIATQKSFVDLVGNVPYTMMINPNDGRTALAIDLGETDRDGNRKIAQYYFDLADAVQTVDPVTGVPTLTSATTRWVEEVLWVDGNWNAVEGLPGAGISYVDDNLGNSIARNRGAAIENESAVAELADLYSGSPIRPESVEPLLAGPDSGGSVATTIMRVLYPEVDADSETTLAKRRIIPVASSVVDKMLEVITSSGSALVPGTRRTIERIRDDLQGGPEAVSRALEQLHPIAVNAASKGRTMVGASAPGNDLRYLIAGKRWSEEEVYRIFQPLFSLYANLY